MFFLDLADVDDNKILTPSEIAAIEEEIMEIIRKGSFFSSIYINGTKIDISGIEFPNARVSSNIVYFSFVIPLPEPVSLLKSGFSASFYDPTYYYDVYLAEENPVKFINESTLSCTYKIEEDMENTYYYNMVNPEIIRVNCDQ